MFPAPEKNFLGRPHYLILICLTLLTIFGQGCATLRHYKALPENLEKHAQIPGLPDARDWADAPSKILLKSALESLEQEKAANHGKLKPVVYGLALSGGGGDGAFGAGLLCGWSKAGTRPTFKLVTGISTGALMSPFAFLGPAYDQRLKEAYTTISDKDIFTQHNILAILLSLANIRPLPSMASTKPLAKLLVKLIDAKLLEDVAAEHLKGRRLLVGTTQLDAQRLVIWDMGAIAVSNYPHKLDLFRKVLLASASIPVAFNPQFFTVTAGGEEFQEMHVDGGVQVEVMLYEDAIKPFAIGGQRRRKLYIIRNEQVDPKCEDVKPQLMDIAIRSIDSLFKAQGVNDLYRLYAYAQSDGQDYNVAYTPRNLPFKPKSEFDTRFMNQLFDYAYNLAKAGYPWIKHPPGFDPHRHGSGRH